nr:hypothetical protein K-LCC10_0148 [Kaumoebavirus]
MYGRKCGKITFGINLPLLLLSLVLLFIYIVPGPQKDVEIVLESFVYLSGTCEYHIRETIEECEPNYYTEEMQVAEPNCQRYYGDTVRHHKIESNLLLPCIIHETNIGSSLIFLLVIIVTSIGTALGAYYAFTPRKKENVEELTGRR